MRDVIGSQMDFLVGTTAGEGKNVRTSARSWPVREFP